MVPGSHGNHYAPALVEDELGCPQGVTRLSFMHYSTTQDLDRALAALEEILA